MELLPQGHRASFGIENGCEAVVIRRWLQKHDNAKTCCFLTKDLDRAFNRLSGPALFANSDDLLLPRKDPEQKEVQQGDLLGPLLFALWKEPSGRAKRKLRPPAAHWTELLSFLTTERWAAHIEATQAFFVGFQRGLDDSGLKLNPTKCEKNSSHTLAIRHPSARSSSRLDGPTRHVLCSSGRCFLGSRTSVLRKLQHTNWTVPKDARPNSSISSPWPQPSPSFVSASAGVR